MAKQSGLFVFEGTVGDATGYKMNGKYYLKTKSEISRRRIREDDRFSNTRRNAKWFGEATQLARKVYYEIERSKRNQHTVWYPLRNKAQELVRKGLAAEEIVCKLREYCELSIVNGELKSLNKESVLQVDEVRKEEIIKKEKVEVSDEILMGRVINPGVEMQLMDQVVASTAFIKTILQPRKKRMELVSVEKGRLKLRR